MEPQNWNAPVPVQPPTLRPWYKKKWVWVVGVLAVLAIAGSAGGSEKEPETQLGAIADNSETTEPAKTEATPTTAAPTTVTTARPTTTTTVRVTTTTTVKVNTCANVREALLTGSQSQIDSAMRALIADKSADDTAREYADYYMTRDAPGSYMSKETREMDVGLIRMACS